MRLRALVRRAAGHARERHRLRARRLRRAARHLHARRPAAQADGARMARPVLPDPAQGRRGGRGDLLERVYDGDAEVDSNSLEVIIARLRRKIGRDRDRDGARPRLPAARRAAMSGRPRSLGRPPCRSARPSDHAWRCLVAGVGIGLVLHRFVRGQVDQRLDAQIALAGLALEGWRGQRAPRPASPESAALRPPAVGLVLGGPRASAGTPIVRSPSLGDGSIDVVAPRFRWQEFWNFRPRPADGTGPRRRAAASADRHR